MLSRGRLPEAWAPIWLAWRLEAGLCATNDLPLLPGARSNGEWGTAAVESGAFGMHLKYLLIRHESQAYILGMWAHIP